MVYDDEITEAWEMLQVTKQHITEQDQSDKEATRSKMGDVTIIVYQTKAEKAEGTGLLTAKNFKEIYNLEKEVMDHKNWTLLCIAKSPFEPQCSDQAFISPAQVIVAAVERSTSKKIDQVTEDEF